MKEQSISWYPLRVTYSREMKVKEFLDTENIENFIPMHYIEKVTQGKKERKLVPAVHNLIFVRTTRQVLDDIKSNSLYSSSLRYIINSTDRKPIIIPEKQMQDFIAVAQTQDEGLMYLTPTEVALKKGDRVRIKSGVWEGVEGKFVRIKRGLRVVVAIEGLMAVATASLHPSLVEVVCVD